MKALVFCNPKVLMQEGLIDWNNIWAGLMLWVKSLGNLHSPCKMCCKQLSCQMPIFFFPFAYLALSLTCGDEACMGSTVTKIQMLYVDSN